MTSVIGGAEAHAAYGELAARFVADTTLEPFESGACRAAKIAIAATGLKRLKPVVTDGLDLIHYPVSVGLPKPKCEIPTVVSLHDVQHHVKPEFFSAAQRMYRSVAYDRMATDADMIFTVSEFARSEIVEYLKVDPSRVLAIHHGLNHDRFNAAPRAGDRDIATSLGAPGRYIIYPASLMPHKNHERLLSALRYPEARSVQLVLTGQPLAGEQDLIERISRAGLTDRVKYLGFVAREAIPALYRCAQGMIFPSSYEGFGFPPLEAMACGCPTAVSDLGPLRELLGDDTLWFDYSDEQQISIAAATIFEDEAVRDRLIAGGIERASEFTWPACAKKHIAGYRSMLAA